MNDLVEWLNAQLAEDEAYARNAFGDHNQAEPEWTEIWSGAVQVGPHEDVVLTNDSQVSRHMVRFDPARVLREVEAKRLILDEHGILERKVGWIEVDEDGTRNDFGAKLPVCRTCVPMHSYFDSREDVPTGPCVTVKLLALPIADRPGYLEEWRPRAYLTG